MTLTKQNLEEMASGEIIAVGIVENSPEGVYMTNYRKGDILFWVAKRGDGYPDWAIYAHFLKTSSLIEEDSEGNATIAGVLAMGDKITGGRDVKTLVDCDDEALSMYRK